MMNIRQYVTNMFVFYNPSFNYNNINFQSKNLIFIDKGKNKDDITNYIPCLFIQEYEQSSKFLIYFHGNSDDIFTSELFCQHLCENLKMNVIIVEYPGYSIYKAEKSAEIICQDSLKVYSFIKEKFKAKDEDIYVVGRSLGTGPAVYLASKEKSIKSLILISPFKSIKLIKNAILSFFLLDIFKSIDIIGNVSCPILFIHGLNDPLIDFTHSEELFTKSDNKNNQNDLILNPEMTHNDFDVEKDIFSQILKFIKDNPNSFPKKAFNLDDTNFKNLFKIPIPTQKFLFKENINSSKPTKFELKAKCALLLNDGRIAFGLKNSNILVYNIDWSLNEKEIEINLNNGYPILYMTQLKNNNLVVCDPINVHFYSLSKYRSKLISSHNMNDKVKKVVQINDKEIIILCEDSIKLIDDNFKVISLKNEKCNDLIISSNRIVISKFDRIEIFEFLNKKLVSIDNVEFKSIDSIYSLINMDNIVVALGKNEYLIIDIKKLDYQRYNHQINNPSHIWKIDINSFLIWNDIGNIIYYEYNNMKFIENQIYTINSKKITSIIKLFDGSLIITNDTKVSKEEENENNCKFM